jgi:aspartate racemase
MLISVAKGHIRRVRLVRSGGSRCNTFKVGQRTLRTLRFDGRRTLESTVAASGSGEIIGILGGMGPAATADFYGKLVAMTPARSDQEHLRTVIWSDPTVPDRTEALLGDGPDPTPALLHGCRVLRDAGATVIAIPCNTAHAFIPRFAAAAGLPIIHMIDEVAGHLAADPAVRTAGLLATNGTVRSGLYQQSLRGAGIELVLPDPTSQDEEVMTAIRAIKAGQRGDAVVKPLRRAAERLVERGAQSVIAGCTEIPLGVSPAEVDFPPLLDPAVVLARALIRRSYPRADLPWPGSAHSG